MATVALEPHVPVYATRGIRNLAAALIVASGVSHVAQLWLSPLSGELLVSAMFGMVYLLTGLGLSGHSRLPLWLATFLPLLSLAVDTGGVSAHLPLQAWHVLADAAISALGFYVLVKTRHAVMD